MTSKNPQISSQMIFVGMDNTKVGMKIKKGKKVPNCVPEK